MGSDQRSLRKIILAVILSASCYGITHLIFVLTEPSRGNQNEAEPIAYTTRVFDEVERRPVARMIWHMLIPGEAVYPGEAIRTSSKGDVQIQFVGSGRVLDLEPDTMIILTKKENEIALDLLDGSVFIAQNESKDGKDSEAKLTLKSKSGVIDLSKATASLSNTDGKIELQVLKGQATTADQKAIGVGDTNAAIQIVEPAGDRPQFVNGLQTKSVRFKWQGATAGRPIELWIGSQRRNLKVQSKITNGADSEFRLDLSPGKYFWQLRAENGESQIQRFEVVSLGTPQPLSPAHQQSLILETNLSPVEFRWSNPTGVKSTTFELSQDPFFKQVLNTEVHPASKTFTTVPLAAGRYYWRVSSFYPEHQQMASGPVWIVDTEIGQRKLTEIEWSPELTREKFFVEKPKLDLAWKEVSSRGAAKSWLIKIAANEADLEDPKSAISIATQNQKIESLLPKQGRWIASVEGLDAAGNRVSKSPIKEFNLSPLPLLKAPLFAEPEGDFKATPSGDLKLSWSNVEGAKEYWIILKNSEGKEVQNKKFEKNSTALTSLMPGIYSMELFAKDAFGRKSEAGPERKILVPESSGLSAPKLRRVKVN